MSRLKKGVLALLLALLAGVLYFAFQSVYPASRLLLNGRIYTVADATPWVEAVEIRSGLIQSVGTTEELRSKIGWRTHVIDLEGRMAMPGLHDAHIHLVMGSINRRINCNLVPDSEPDAIIASLKKCQREGVTTKGWLVGGNYNPNKFPNSSPNRSFLDEHFPNTPVYLDDYSQHSSLVNGKALEVLGMTSQIEDPPTGHYGRDPRTGELTGLIAEGAKGEVTVLIPKPSPLKVVRALRETFMEINRFGTTSVQDAVSVPQTVQLLSLLDRFGVVTADVDNHWIQEFTTLSGISVVDQRGWLDDRASLESDNIHVNNVKVILDGVPLPPEPTHATLDPLTGEPDEKMLTISEDALAERLTHWDGLGIKAKLHAVGDGAARVALNAISRARDANPASGVIHDIAHGQGMHPEDRDRPAALAAAVVGALDVSCLRALVATAEQDHDSILLTTVRASVDPDFPLFRHSGIVA